MAASIGTLIIIATLALNPGTPLIVETPVKKIVNHRPYHLTGTLTVGDLSFTYGSGGNGASIPYGDHEITPAEVGPWGERHKAIGLAGNSIYDPQLGRDREGIEIHAADHLESAGCVVVLQEHFKALKGAIFAMIERTGHAFLHIHPDGVSITPEQTIESSVVYIPQKETIEAEHSSKHRKHYAERQHRHSHVAQHHHNHYAHSHYKHYAGR